MTEEIKKNYNPFKMLGSYAGLIILPLVLASLTNFNNTPYFQKIMNFIAGLIFFEGVIGFIMSFLILAIGFLFGWGIHSLIRKYVRDK